MMWCIHVFRKQFHERALSSAWHPPLFFGKKNRSGSGSDIILLQFERIPVSASSLLQRHRQRGSVSKLQMSFSKNDQVFNTLHGPLPQLFRLQSFTCLVLLWEFVIYFSPELWLCLRSEGLEENEWHPWEKSAQYPPNNTTAAIRLKIVEHFVSIFVIDIQFSLQ